MLNHVNGTAFSWCSEDSKLEISIPMCYAVNHQHSHLSFPQGGLLTQDILAPKNHFRHIQTISAQTGSKVTKKKQCLSTLLEDTQSYICTWAAEIHWSEMLPSVITFPCRPLKESWAAENHKKPFKSWQVSKKASASPNDSTTWSEKKKQNQNNKIGYFSKSCAMISHLSTTPRLLISAQMQYLPSDSFGTFSCSVWKAAPMQAVISCGPLKSHSQTCPSAHFKAGRSFPPPFPAVMFSLLHIPFCPPDLLGNIQQGHKKVSFDWWTKWHLSMRKERGLLQARRLREGKISYWWIRWSKTHGLSISFLFSHKPLGLL